MTLTLSDEMEAFVKEQVKSGEYKSTDEVVREGLRLLKAREKGLETFRREIMRGILDVQDGRMSSISSDSEVEAFTDEVISDARNALVN